MIGRPLLGAALAGALALTACTSTVTGHGIAGGRASTSAVPGGGTVVTSGAPTAARSGNAALSAAQLEKAAKAALTSATAFHIKGQATDSGTSISFDVRYGAASSDGTLTISGATVRLRYASGQVFMNGSDKFWRQVAGAGSTPDDQAALALLRGKWVRLPKGTPGLSDIANFAIRSKFQQQIANSEENQTYTRGPSKTVNGVAAISIVASDDGSTLYVAATGTPFPIRIEDHSSDPGTFDLSQYNVPFSAPTPPAGEIVDLPH